MNNTEAHEYLRTHRQAILATIKRDGRPQLSNVLTVYREGVMQVSITQTRSKFHNLVRDPRASLLVLGDNFWQYLTVEGTASMVTLPDARIPLREYFESAQGKPHPNWEEYDAAMASEQRVMLSISIDKVYPLTG